MSTTLSPSYPTPTADNINTLNSNAANNTNAENLCSLLDLAKHQPAIIDDIVANERFGDIDNVISQRLKDLGFLPNTIIQIVAKGLFGKPPYAVQLSTGAQFSLRADELIKIRCLAITIDSR